MDVDSLRNEAVSNLQGRIGGSLQVPAKCAIDHRQEMESQGVSWRVREQGSERAKEGGEAAAREAAAS